MRGAHLAGIFVVLLFVTAFGPPVAEACFCGPDCTASASAETIFEATVVRIESGQRLNANGSYSSLPNRVHLADVRAWRGEATSIVMSGNDSCHYQFQVGTRYVIVASRDPRDGQFWPSQCSMTRPLAEAGSFRDYVDSLSKPSRGGHVWGRVAARNVINAARSQPPTMIPIQITVSHDRRIIHRSETLVTGEPLVIALTVP